VRGTFNRSIAVRREDLIFFAPGSDPWTDAVIANAMGADRGRACAALWQGAPLVWTGLEFTFTLAVNPRPLYALGHDPTKLYDAQGYLHIPVHRVLVSLNGEVLNSSHAVAAAIRNRGTLPKSSLRHMGERSGTPSKLQQFRSMFPPETWPELVFRLEAAARAHLQDEFSFLEEEAESARRDFEARIRGSRAAKQWLGTELAHDGEVDVFEEVAAALVDGIQDPLIRLESICCWLLRPVKEPAA
jgi:ATP-dependent helicase HepA